MALLTWVLTAVTSEGWGQQVGNLSFDVPVFVVRRTGWQSVVILGVRSVYHRSLVWESPLPPSLEPEMT